MGLAGTPISLAELAQAGVARVSVGGSLARASFGLVRRAAEEMMTRGSFDFAAGQIPDAEPGKLFRTLRK
ncbi:MAG: 2-methylisocitrate lyase-like PEP mutase family enzyme [Gammaproteobacteria bacterium]|jgi:2-methylisocitrate lyase-like PEP mutase family enzyme